MLNLNYIFGKLLFLNEKQVNKLNYNLLLNIFKYLRLKEFYMIDDYRHIQLFSKKYVVKIMLDYFYISMEDFQPCWQFRKILEI